MTNLVKHSGQVFTPDYLVNLILDEAGYQGTEILKKHCIDNSCGDGAFLCEIIERYITAYKSHYGTFEGLRDDLKTYIHGIEIETSAYECCMVNVNSVFSKYGLTEASIDLRQANTLTVHDFDGRMDFVVGNPPYVRVHNLEENFNSVKSFSFAGSGMTDLYLVFFEIGLTMLRPGGKLCYITPSSWINSVAGSALRTYILSHRNLISIIDLGHYQAFKATTYTMISLFQKGTDNSAFAFYEFDPATYGKSFVCNIPFDAVAINGYFYLADNSTLDELRQILTPHFQKYVSVKNGFATLADKVFIAAGFPFESQVIPVIKASTGKWYKAFYPYDKNGKPLSKEAIFGDAARTEYLETNKKTLLKDANEDENPFWYLFGRTQALKDVYSEKISINTTIKDVKSLKLYRVPAGAGLYSGLYILPDTTSFDVISRIILSEDFIKYVASLKKYKSGGYYTYNSKDLELYLNFKISQLVKMETLKPDSQLNADFLNAITLSFKEFLKKGTSRSTDKLKPLHGQIAKDIAAKLGEDYEVWSQGFDKDKEAEMKGRYIDKKVDITIKHNGKPVAGIAVKFVMQNYSQNSNNYFENMLGETANIRCAGYPYFQVFIILEKLPYYNSDKLITKWETFTEHNINKYIILSKDDINVYFHTPNKTLIYVVQIPEPAKDVNIKDASDYFNYYRSHEPVMSLSKTKYKEFGSTVILNDYEGFLSKVYHTIMAL